MSSNFGLKKVREGDVLTVDVSGRFDTDTAPEIDAGVKAELGDVKKLVLDLSKVEYISSSGLRVILGLNKALTASGGELVIKNPSQMVRDVFEITKFINILNIEK